MSEVLDELTHSVDPIDRELARTLKEYQRIRASRGLSRSVGYEPRDIRKFGAVEVIQRRIRNQSSGFDEVPVEFSYEKIVLNYPERFQGDVVVIARDRIATETSMFGPTTDPKELDKRVQQLLGRAHMPHPNGTKSPQRVDASNISFLRDPRVKAWALNRARGFCEACKEPAPFKNIYGLGYLEVHHMRTLADGGSDTTQNAVALCPNCHRGLHYAHDAGERANCVYERVPNLVRE